MEEVEHFAAVEQHEHGLAQPRETPALDLAQLVDAKIERLLDSVRHSAIMVAAVGKPPRANLPPGLLRSLLILCGEDTTVDKSVSLLDTMAVERLECPSGAVCWRVEFNAARAKVDVSDDLLEESGVRRKYYTVVSGFCSCLSFAEEVLMSDVTLKGTPMAAMRGAQSSTSPTGAGAVGPIDSCKVAGIRPGWRRYCKHLLAVRLAEALGPTRYKSRAVSNEEMTQWMAEM